MNSDDPVSRAGSGSWLLRVWAQPGARKSAVAGFYQGRVKIRIGAPAVDSKANKALVRFVASALTLRPRQVSLRDGHTARKKTLLIESEHEPHWEAVLPCRAANQ